MARWWLRQHPVHEPRARCQRGAVIIAHLWLAKPHLVCPTGLALYDAQQCSSLGRIMDVALLPALPC